MGTLSHHRGPRPQLYASWLSHYFIWLSISPDKSLNITFFYNCIHDLLWLVHKKSIVSVGPM